MAMSTTSSVASTVSASASASASSTGNGGGGGSGPSSPLLFFVALGFGVVFTNLWIIVGVKYCFRYNQRNRMRMQAEGEDAVDLNAMPRQHRRRREKKLMTMEEVNEKFPLTKYKLWRATRAERGLPTAGGIMATTVSRPPSISERRESKAESKTEELHRTGSLSIMDEKLPNHEAPEVATAAAEPSAPRPQTAQSSHNPSDSLAPINANENDEDDDDRIQTAVPAEHLPDPGDACAICIDTIDDDDDVRGLHCGHAFHASCVDPWLTSRRACCPLCKADYYVPKPRPEGQEGQDQHRPSQVPPGTFVVGNPGRRPTVVLPARVMHIVYPDRHHDLSDSGRPPRPSRAERRQQQREERERSASAATTLDQAQTQQEQSQTGWRSRLPHLRISNPISTLRGRQVPVPPNTTPGELEAGRAQS
ncbi:hypothetical protein DV736_g4340, partial [Chaetothyriales sp. CBS 134916]